MFRALRLDGTTAHNTSIGIRTSVSLESRFTTVPNDQNPNYNELFVFEWAPYSVAI
jgi:hypothetical protein